MVLGLPDLTSSEGLVDRVRSQCNLLVLSVVGSRFGVVWGCVFGRGCGSDSVCRGEMNR